MGGGIHSRKRGPPGAGGRKLGKRGVRAERGPPAPQQQARHGADGRWAAAGPGSSEWKAGLDSGRVSFDVMSLLPVKVVRAWVSGAKLAAEDVMYGKGRWRFGVAGLESPWLSGGRLRLSLFHLLLLILQNAQPDAKKAVGKSAWARSHVASKKNPPRPRAKHENLYKFKLAQKTFRLDKSNLLS